MRRSAAALLLACITAMPAIAQDKSEFFSPIPEGSDALFVPVDAGQEPTPEQAVVLKTRDLFDELAVIYRAALERLATDGDSDRPAILQTVVDLEVRGIGDTPERRLPRLGDLEMRAVRELASQDPEVLVPIFQLHHDLYLAHRRARNWWLLHHEMAMVRALTSLYVDEAGGGGAGLGARKVAAQALTSLGGHMQAGGQPLAYDFFEEAVAYDPRNEAALLGMVVHFEKRGGPFDEVERNLERLLAAYPQHREGRLRQAVNLFRTDSADPRAIALLESLLLEEETTDWITSLATQELARCFSRDGRVDDAATVLEDARRRLPGDQKLAIQLSFVYDLARRDGAAGRLAREVRDGVAHGGRTGLLAAAADPPRGRYNKWPSTALTEDRRQLREMARSRQPLLARLLHQQQGPPAVEVHP